MWRKAGFAVTLVASKEGEEQRIQEILGEDEKLKTIRPRFLRGTLNEGFRVTFRDGAKLGWENSASGSWSSPRPKSSADNASAGHRSINAPSPSAPRSISSSISRSWLRVTSWFTFSTASRFIAASPNSTPPRDARGHLARVRRSRDFARSAAGVAPDQPLCRAQQIATQLGRIGSGRWEKARAAAERATVDLAAELLRIQAEREAQPGHAFSDDTTWQKEFEASFPFTETRDQLRAIKETKSDMERTRPWTG